MVFVETPGVEPRSTASQYMPQVSTIQTAKIIFAKALNTRGAMIIVEMPGLEPRSTASQLLTSVLSINIYYNIFL